MTPSADLVRELIDGAAGLSQGNDNLPVDDPSWWATYRDRLEQAALDAAAGDTRSARACRGASRSRLRLTSAPRAPPRRNAVTDG